MKESDILKQNNFNFNKKFGQNFIYDKNLLNAIIEQSGINSEDEVLEIGPGAGTLTKVIAQKAKKVVSYEIDTNLKPILAENLKDVTKEKIIYQDELKNNLNEIESNFTNEYTLIANLPY